MVLIARAQLGDLRALDLLLAALQEPLFRHISILLGDEHAAEDVLQDSLLIVSRKLSALRDPRWFRAWAYRIATREAMRHARRARREPDAVDPHDLANVVADDMPPAFDPDLIAALPDAVRELSPASQVVLRMHYFDGLTHLEVAEALEISVGTVKSRLAYGLAALRKTVKS
ncbi:MAG: RNA polymerase sigma factor [Gemmatimonadaceae bacterium]